LDDVDQRQSELMRRAQHGDRQAYEALLIETASRVRAFVRRRVREADQVEDIVQETLLSIHANRHTYDPERAYSPWMYAIAKHRMLDQLAKQRRRSAHESAGERVEELEAPIADEPTGFAERALALLSHAQREVIQLLKLEGYSVAEIALKTGRSETSVKVTAHRGYKQLRALLSGARDDE
jgi:RNA polymerase sigma-70 factor (ECF subfamily)